MKGNLGQNVKVNDSRFSSVQRYRRFETAVALAWKTVKFSQISQTLWVNAAVSLLDKALQRSEKTGGYTYL